MADHLFDTSALVKYYHAEAGRPQVTAIIDAPTHRIFISRLSLIEWHSTFSRKTRTGEMSLMEFQTVRRRFYADLRSRKLRLVALEHVHHRQAVQLLLKYGLTQNIRTLDALQLSVALDLRQQGYLDHFVCADVALCDVAQRERLSVINPEISQASGS